MRQTRCSPCDKHVRAQHLLASSAPPHHLFFLVERQVRRAIAPAIALDGLYAGQPAKPTGRLIFKALTVWDHPG
jgi:hypothetical protein